jgi:murein DD-endopeptidase MepM/ murein hydrolase activator NlpD
MRRGVWLLILGVLATAFGAASALADGTTTGATTTGTTTGTTTTTTPSYAPLASSALPAGCVGAGAAALVLPSRRVVALGTPAANLGPSAYPTSAPVVAFGSSAAGGLTCRGARVALESVSLFGGAVTATSVAATDGRGTVAGLEIDGTAVSAAPGQTLSVGGWGRLTRGATIGRVSAPLVLRLLQTRNSLPAGTVVAVAFAASPLPVHKSKPKQPSSTQATSTTPARNSLGRAPRHEAKKHRHPKRPKPEPLTVTPPLGFEPSHYVFPVDGGASYVDTYGANRNDIYDGWHHGDDLFAPLGTPVVAVANGKLSLVGWNRLGGWRLWLTDGDGNSFYYAHLAGYSRWVLQHPNVRAGQVVGFLGRTGDAFTTTPHLHFEIHPHQLLSLGYDGAVDPTAYLHKWRVVRVPANEMPQPATLKAPRGTPAEEASVVWHQLLLARHLLHTTGPVSSSAIVRRPWPRMTIDAEGESPLHIAHVSATASAAAAGSEEVWVAGGLLGALGALSAGAGAFTFRRRRRAPGESSS